MTTSQNPTPFRGGSVNQKTDPTILIDKLNNIQTSFISFPTVFKELEDPRSHVRRKIAQYLAKAYFKNCTTEPESPEKQYFTKTYTFISEITQILPQHIYQELHWFIVRNLLFKTIITTKCKRQSKYRPRVAMEWYPEKKFKERQGIKLSIIKTDQSDHLWTKVLQICLDYAENDQAKLKKEQETYIQALQDEKEAENILKSAQE